MVIRPLSTAAFWAAALLAAPCFGAATDDSVALATAGAVLEAKLGAPGVKAQMSPTSDPDVRAFEAQAEKGLIELGTAAMPVQGLDSYDRLCGSAARITAAYVSAGIGPIGPEGLPMNDQAKVAQMTQNTMRYMDQLFTPLLYSAHCTAMHLPPIEKALSDEDVKNKAGALAQIRDGAFQQASGLMQMAASNDMDAGRRRKVLDLLVRDAGNFSTVFNRAQRQQFGQMALELGRTWPEAKARTDRIEAAIDARPCGRLCLA